MSDHHNGYLPPGTSVRFDGSDIGPEYGVVVHCWFDEDIQNFDCYIAFFGALPITGKPDTKPYLLRYAASSLTVLTLNSTAD